MRISSLVNEIGPVADYSTSISEAFPQRSISPFTQTAKTSINQFRDEGGPIYRRQAPLSQPPLNGTMPLFNFNASCCPGNIVVSSDTQQTEVERKDFQTASESMNLMEPRIDFSNFGQQPQFPAFHQQNLSNHRRSTSLGQQESQAFLSSSQTMSSKPTYLQSEFRQSELDIVPLTHSLPRLSLESNGKQAELYNYRENANGPQPIEIDQKTDIKSEKDPASSSFGQGAPPSMQMTTSATSVFATPRIPRHRRTQSASSTLDLIKMEDNSSIIKRKHICHVEGCGKNFSTSGHLARHRRLHTGEKPFSCPIDGCSSRFNRHDNMLQHWRSHQRKLTISSSNSFVPVSFPHDPAAKSTVPQPNPPQINKQPQILFDTSPTSENDNNRMIQQQQQSAGGFQSSQVAPGHQTVTNLRNAQQMHRRHHSYSGTPANLFPDSTPLTFTNPTTAPALAPVQPQFLRNRQYLTSNNTSHSMPGPPPSGFGS